MIFIRLEGCGFIDFERLVSESKDFEVWMSPNEVPDYFLKLIFEDQEPGIQKPDVFSPRLFQ